MLLRIDALEQAYVTLNQTIIANIDQSVRTTDTPTFAGIITGGLVDGVDISAFKSAYDAMVSGLAAFEGDYDIRMAEAESDIAELEGIVAGDLVIGKLNVNADKDWNGYAISNPGLIDGVDISAFKADYDAKVDQGVKSTSTPTFAAIVVTGNVDGVDISAFKSDYDSRMATAESDISALEGIVAGDLVITKLNVNADKDWNAKAITNMSALGVNGNITVGGTVDGVDIAGSINQGVKSTDSPTFAAITVTGNVDGVDISAFKSEYDTNINQAVKTTSSPTFAAITVTGNVNGVDLSAFKADYDAKVNQDLRTTATPIHQNLIIGAISASDTLQISNDTNRARAASDSYALTKEDLINSFLGGVMRVKWEMSCGGSSQTVYAQVFVNGVVVGVEKSQVNNISFNAYTDDVTVRLQPGDKIQLYYKTVGTGNPQFRNFRLCWTNAAKAVIAESVFNY
jgi:hypothetical protein